MRYALNGVTMHEASDDNFFDDMRLLLQADVMDEANDDVADAAVTGDDVAETEQAATSEDVAETEQEADVMPEAGVAGTAMAETEPADVMPEAGHACHVHCEVCFNCAGLSCECDRVSESSGHHSSRGGKPANFTGI